ncbi:hypothetical protein SDC9_170622 [bioreactor metagenome]|uniref:Uncharacterized protein n=1 Tax=bioreactor metagenome TaxID=1076179 RepID=A0A645GH76_9ZZZZ
MHRKPHNQGLKPQAQQRPDVHGFQPGFQVRNQGVKVNAGFPDNDTGALVHDGLSSIKDAHDDIPCVRHNEDGKGTLKHPAEEQGRIEVVHVVLFHNHFNQLIAHHQGENRRRNGDNDRFGQGLQHGKNAAVPVLRRAANIRCDFPDFGIDCVKQAGQVAHDTVDQDSFDPFPD